MSQDEVVAILKARHNDHELLSQERWEQTRLMCHYGFRAGSKKPSDLFKLPGDREVKKIETVSKEEALKRLQEMRKNRKHG